jgi:uncharacterized protein (TIGR02996 family)
MTPEEAFLEDIFANPADDVPRLVYADWLDDHDLGERAELIRVQCEMDDWPEGAPRRTELEERERLLLARWGSDWLGPAPEEFLTWQLRRGFPEATVEPIHLPRHRGAVLRLDWNGPGEVGPDSAAWSALESALPGQASALRLLGLRAGADDLAALLALPCLQRLRVLELPDVPLTRAVCEVLEAAPCLSGLASLEVHLGSWLSGPTLAFCRALSRVRALALRGPLPPDGLLELLVSDNVLPRLHTLCLGPNRRMGDACVEVLAGSSLLGQLGALDLHATDVYPENGLRALLAATTCLRTLRLGENSLRDKGAQTLATAPSLANLTRLYLDNCWLKIAGVSALAGSPHLANLTLLDLSGNSLSSDDARALAASGYLTRLTSLSLARTHVGDKGARALARAANLSNLHALHLRDAGISGEGALALAASPYLEHLRTLDLTNNPIHNAGAEALRQRFGKSVKL